MFGYIYKTTNLVNGKIYVGQHKADEFEPDFYIGSGTLFRRAVEKYGSENFKNELLCECFSQKDMDEKEMFWISELNTLDSSIGYNLTKGGFGGASPRTEDTKNKIAEYNTGKTLVNDGVICFRIKQSDLKEYLKLGYSYGTLPYKRTSEFKEKVSKTTTGRICISKGNIRTRIDPEKLPQYLDEGYSIGWVKEEDKKKNIRKKIPGEGRSKYMNKDNVYLLIPESRQKEYLEKGWVYGAKKNRKKFIHKRGYSLSDITKQRLSESHKGKKLSKESIEKGKKTRAKTIAEKGAAAKGKIWINNGETSKMISPERLPEFANNGWNKGRIYSRGSGVSYSSLTDLE